MKNHASNTEGCSPKTIPAYRKKLIFLRQYLDSFAVRFSDVRYLIDDSFNFTARETIVDESECCPIP